ncbi:ninein isoform X5 [Denticeps clupeoides]|uniref:ninein isoform X5 n=1 Tax=Denticeps clupeoides TaxID=299321 RepID=UPI0010A39CFC|nr:ninein isoform X5 [Denticeps clupeoides]
MELLLKGRVLSCGMDETQQDLYEERLKEVFRSFDASGVGSLSPEELVELCQALQLQEAAPTLLHGLLQEQDSLTGRVDFEQFKNALILVLSSSSSSSSTSEPQENQETSARPGSPEVHPKFVKGGKRYGRRSTPEFIESVTDFTATIAEKEGEVEEGYSEDSAVPRKRERWNSHDSSTEEYEAEGQLHLWNPDEPGTPRGTRMPLRERVEERLHAACTDLALPWDAPVTKQQLLLLCQHADMEVTEEQWQWVDEQGEMSVSEFTVLFSRSQPPTPSSSTPYRQLKRHHSTQPFDESGRRISVVTSTLGLRLFSALDDGTGHTPAEYLLDAWIDEGIDNSPEILQALDFSLEGKVNLSELTLALENELLMTKNGIHQAALASFKAEIRHLLERVDRELREKDKIRSDLEKAEKLKSQLASEVDEHHSAIERLNDINLRKLKQDHKERFSALRLELTQEMDRLQQQANQQREELEAEVKKAREDETFLRERLALTAKENGRLEAELLDSTEKLVEAENQASKLQESLDNVLKEKFGDLDPDSSEFFLQEDRLCRLRRNYEEQCRELQDRIDELQAELEEYRVVGRMAPPPSVPSLSEELNSKSPGIESDQGLGSEEGQPFNMSLEAEMLLEQAKEHHLKDIETVQSQYQQLLEEQKAAQEEMRTELSSQHQEELQPLREELSQALSRAQKLQIQLDQLVEERVNFEIQTEEHRTLNKKHEEEVSAIIQELHESQGQAADLEEQLKALKVQHAEMEEMERQHAEKINRLQQKQDESVQSRLEEQRERLQTMIESEKRLREEWKQDRRHMEQSHEEVLHTRLEKVKVQFEEQRLELERRLNEQLEQKRSQLEERHKEILDALLVEEGLRVLKDHEEKEAKLREQWEEERALLEQQCEATLQNRLAEEQETLHILEEEIERKLVDEFKKQRAQLEEQHRATLEERLQEEREKLQSDKLEMERRWKEVLIEEKWCLEESHREVVQDLTSKHSEERERLSSLLEKLREDIAEERSEAGRLAEENLFLRHKISAIKEEDHRETQEAMMLKLENVRKEKITAQKMAESFKRQISELRCRGQELEDENGLLCQKNAENAAAVEEMSAQLGELIRQTDMQATVQHSDRLVACMSALEAEMNKAKEDAATLQQEKAQLTQQLSSLKHQLCDGGHLASAVSREERLEEEKQVLREELARSVEKVAKLGATESQVTQLRQERQAAERQTQGLRSQLSKAQEKFHTLDGTLQVVNLQNSRLKSDLRVAQQEKDALKQEVMSMHQKLQNANDKIQLLEVSLQASGFPSVQRQLLSAELSRLLEQDHQLLAQENSRLLCELQHAKGELLHTREKACQLELSLVTLKQRQQQQGQTGLLKTLEQDKTSLKRELESLRSELHSVQKKTGDQRQFENLTQENKMLKSRLAHLEAQLLEVQLGEMFPPSPVQLPGEHRGCRGDERGPDFSIQDEREVKMLKMEQRMKEVELMLKNVKMLLQEKVTQLKEQVHKNNKADGMIKGLYVENTQLLQALQLSEQRQKTVEKKNFLLEEKISSLNKIVCDLSPSPLPPAPYTFARLDGSALHHP